MTTEEKNDLIFGFIIPLFCLVMGWTGLCVFFLFMIIIDKLDKILKELKK